MVALECLNEDEIGREPDGAAPVGVSSEHVGCRLAGCVLHLMGVAGVLEDEGFFVVGFGK